MGKKKPRKKDSKGDSTEEINKKDIKGKKPEKVVQKKKAKRKKVQKHKR